MLNDKNPPPRVHNPQSAGRLTVIAGCMFSGKTTELCRRLAARPSSQVCAFKHVIDRRYDAHAVVAHSGLSWPAVPVASAAQIPSRVSADVVLVGVDEGHFFDDDLVDAARHLARQGHHVVITSLDRDSWGRPFAVVDLLMAAADELVFPAAACARCGAVADRTQRLTPIVGENMVGGPESYEPRCQACWASPPEPSLPDGAQRTGSGKGPRHEGSRHAGVIGAKKRV